ncbi:hypothetical protein [Phenylobacterium aquaticum]|uniref:hypothetical protein n=1 Tax=Phenylobacterium aquaticum TaxID=1763816 RepID=UPI0026F0DF7C|nr:hypothetical protein [Phenylobacterium aquaticum]
MTQMKPLKRLSILAAVVAATAGLAACETPSPEGGVRIDNQNDLRPTLNTVRVIDATLARYKNMSKTKVDSLLDVEGAYVSTGPTGFKKITVQIRNKTDVALPLEVRASWYDANGVPTDQAQSWTRLFAQPQAMVTFEQGSTRLNSAQYYVEVRGAQ